MRSQQLETNNHAGKAIPHSKAMSTELMKPLMVVDRSIDYEGTNNSHCGGTWFKPTTFVQLLELLKEYGGPNGEGFKIVVGNTEVGIGKRKKTKKTNFSFWF